MSLLKIYADEAGTMPLADTDEPFVTGMVSVVGSDLQIRERHNLGKAPEFCGCLSQVGANIHFCYIRPGLGYAKAIGSKLSKMDTMARMTRLMTGGNTKYLPPEGISYRNMVWSISMNQAMYAIFLRAAASGPVSEVEMFFDQKTMARQSRTHFREAAQMITNNLRRTVLRFADARPLDAAQLLRNVDGLEHIKIHWSDEPDFERASDGLTVAHHLSSLARRFLIKGRTDFSEYLTTAGYTQFEKDITATVTAPISRESIESWKKQTGLLEPQA
jgi:hypothetical protein